MRESGLRIFSRKLVLFQNLTKQTPSLAMAGAWTVGKISELAERIKANVDDEIWMKNVALSDNNARQIADLLCENSKLQEIWLSECEITDAGAIELARVLKSPKSSLRYVNLSGNEIGEDGAKALFATLRTNRKLEAFFLNGNRIGDDSIVELADALEVNQTFREVYLWDNNLTDASARALEAVLRNVNHALIKLDIDNGDDTEMNQIEDKQLIEAINSHTQRNLLRATSGEIKERSATTYRRFRRTDYEKA